jgi:ABC-type lipoprotein release transport system permease subunit
MLLDKKLVNGRYLDIHDKGILVSQGLAKYLGVTVGDSLISLSQGYQGASATSLFKIIGIVKLPSPEFDNQLVFMPLMLSQEYYSAGDRITSVVLDIKTPRKLDQTLSKLNKELNLDKYEVMSWREMMVELYQLFVAKEAGGVLLQLLLYLIVGFGVFGTVLMMISERRHEFGVMIALGMRRTRLTYYFGTELIYICVIGLFGGLACSFPLVVYYHFHPIAITGSLAKSYASFGLEPAIMIAWQSDYIVQQAINVVFIVILALIYPIYSIFKLNVPDSLRR